MHVIESVLPRTRVIVLFFWFMYVRETPWNPENHYKLQSVHWLDKLLRVYVKSIIFNLRNRGLYLSFISFVSNSDLTNWLRSLLSCSSRQLPPEVSGKKELLHGACERGFCSQVLNRHCAALGVTCTPGGRSLETPQGPNKWKKRSMESEVNWKSAWLTS